MASSGERGHSKKRKNRRRSQGREIRMRSWDEDGFEGRLYRDNKYSRVRRIRSLNDFDYEDYDEDYDEDEEYR